MITATSIDAQLSDLGEHKPRVLVVGAGVAGLTVAQLLRGRGLRPVLVERSGSAHDGAGYMLGLMPFVDPVIAALGVEADYLDRSVGMHRYRLRGASGRALRTYSLDAALSRFGRLRGIERSALLRVIATADAPVAFGTTVTAVDQSPRSVKVQLEEDGAGVDAEFDAVIVAEGMGSTTRDLVLGADQVHTYDSGWGGWLAWIDADDDTDLYEETWGAGFFLGLYPVPDRLGVFVAGPRTETAGGPSVFAEQVRDRLATIDDRCARAISAVAAAEKPYYWTLTDVRCTTWVAGRVALLGDSATGFLPTAGVGAAMAMESAAVLAEDLATSPTSSVPEAFRAFEHAQRPRVEVAQENSRQLARLMFRRGQMLAHARDVAARFVGVKSALRPIIKLLKDRNPRRG